jgi:hypothetical protein
LTEIVQVGIQQVKSDHETDKNFVDFQPLLPRESECSKRRKATTSAQFDAKKHQTELADLEPMVV